MGLDKWIKPEETVKKSEKKEDARSTRKPKNQPIEKIGKKEPIKLTKFVLICSKPKCKYKKTIMKKELSEKDRTCPRCKNVMKVQ
ncbi:MAG: hypothetical protein E3J90_13910 [Promethearchaeota archaeon]|nr:MAG: hypothetical protein E3J90_13910 [Candidatus Lokiarchaeota archaeon]